MRCVPQTNQINRSTQSDPDCTSGCGDSPGDIPRRDYFVSGHTANARGCRLNFIIAIITSFLTPLALWSKIRTGNWDVCGLYSGIAPDLRGRGYWVRLRLRHSWMDGAATTCCCAWKIPSRTPGAAQAIRSIIELCGQLYRPLLLDRTPSSNFGR